MCKRQIINAGTETVYVRDTEDEYRVIRVQSWIDDDESLDKAKPDERMHMLGIRKWADCLY